VPVAQIAQPGQEVVGRDQDPSLPDHGLDDHPRHDARRHLVREQHVLDVLERRAPHSATGARHERRAIGVRVRGVDVPAHEGHHVGAHAGFERPRRLPAVGEPEVLPVEREDDRPARSPPHDPPRRLVGFGPGGEEDRPVDAVGKRREQPFGQLDALGAVARARPAGDAVVLERLHDRGPDLLVAVADVVRAPARPEVDETVAVHVLDQRAFAPVGEEAALVPVPVRTVGEHPPLPLHPAQALGAGKGCADHGDPTSRGH